MPVSNVLDQCIRHAQFACLGLTEAMHDVFSEVFIMVRLRDEAVAVYAQLHVVRALRPTFQEQRLPVQLRRLVAIFYYRHVVLVNAVRALDELFLETQHSAPHSLHSHECT